MSLAGQGILRIGTSGIVVPGTKQTFPEQFREKSRLYYYGSLFNSLEINSSFHQMPRITTLKKWHDEVPENFKFTLKVWRQITHVKKLQFSMDDIDSFMRVVNHIGDKKGCLLIQFPASITFEYLHPVKQIIQKINQLNEDDGWKISLELRHSSWYNIDTYSMLTENKTSLVFHDIAASKTPFENPATDIVYFRFHGPTGNYRGSYTDDFLQEYAGIIKSWLLKGKDVYVYFNNTMGSAFENAKLLGQLIQENTVNVKID